MAGGEGLAFSPICAGHRRMGVSCQGAWLSGNGQWRGRPGVRLLPDFHCGKDYINLEGVPAEVLLTWAKIFSKNRAFLGIKILLLCYNSADSRNGLIQRPAKCLQRGHPDPFRNLVNKIFWVCYNKWSQGVDHPDPCFQKPRQLCQNIRRSTNPQRLKLP